MAAFAIGRSHEDAGFDAPVHHGVARTVLEELTRDRSPGPTRALPLDLDCYLAIRKAAHKPRWGRGGRLERPPNARRRGALDVAMIGLMRDARLRVSEAAELTWGDIERVRGGSGRLRLVGAEEISYRELSADMMRLLLAPWQLDWTCNDLLRSELATVNLWPLAAGGVSRCPLAICHSPSGRVGAGDVPSACGPQVRP